MDAIATHRDYGVTGEVLFDPCPTSPLDDRDTAWTLIADSRCPVDLQTRAYTPFSGFRSDFRFGDEIRANRQPRDTVALLRVDDHGGGYCRIRRVHDIADCNAIARIDNTLIADEWPDGREGAYRYLDGVLEELNAYFAGDVYGFTVTDGTTEVDSCWGYFGDTDYVKSEMRESVEHHAQQARERNLLSGLAPLAPYHPDVVS